MFGSSTLIYLNGAFSSSAILLAAVENQLTPTGAVTAGSF